jgi:hypothetical protein
LGCCKKKQPGWLSPVFGSARFEAGQRQLFVVYVVAHNNVEQALCFALENLSQIMNLPLVFMT